MTGAWLIVVGVAVLVVVAALLAARPTGRRTALAALTLGATALAWAALAGAEAARRQRSRQSLEGSVPHRGRGEEGFVSSETCGACHPDQHASWRRSYHRTMTTLAAPDTVRGSFDGVALASRGRDYRLERRGDEFWAEMTDPDWERGQRVQGIDPDATRDPPRAWRRIVMTTGSHHMQTHWVASRSGREVFNVPFVYLFEQGRWVPREDVFLRPPDAGRLFAVWNNSCIECHSTAGKVGFDFARERFDSSVAEMGIACEACHGPARAHVEANRSLWRRYRLHFTGSPDPTIVHPGRLEHRASSQVCGQCHGIAVPDAEDWLKNGHRYRPGDDLEATRFVVRPAVDRGSPRMRALLEKDPTALDTRFWADGMVRVSGREYNAMIESGCYTRGDLSCLSCHSMHESAPDDQLARGMEGKEACLQCHPSHRAGLQEHTRHGPSSAGSECYDCHMPHTTYGLLKAIRSHWIDSPSVATNVKTGRPNACNLCHLDRTLAWTQQHLERWYGAEPVTLAEGDRRVAASVAALLRGEAGTRALIAWHMGWEPARQASGRGWLAPYLAHLLEDPYAAVRYVAERSLRGLPGYERFPYDFLAPPGERARARRAVLDIWFDLPAAGIDRKGTEVLIDAAGNPMDAVLARLARERDDRPVLLEE
jgi:predicted CXXCH cytochrome family protein